MKESFRVRQNHEGKMEMQEMSLSGKLALVTGSSRDIGASIAIELAKKGAHVIGNYRDRKKEKRAKDVSNTIHAFGGEIDFVRADITSIEERNELYNSVANFSVTPTLDLLVLSASGPTTEVNVDAANALLDIFLPIMPKGGKIILMQSVPGHFYDALNSEEIPEFYRPIAQAKHEGEKSLVNRIPEMNKKGVIFNIVCPPEVPDTSNMRIFERIDPDALKKHAIIARQLGLPENVEKEMVGIRVSELASLQTPQGYIEFFTTSGRAF